MTALRKNEAFGDFPPLDEAQIIKRLLALEDAKHALLPRNAAGDTAWETLLVTADQMMSADGASLNVLANRVRAPSSTLMRYIEVLMETGVLERTSTQSCSENLIVLSRAFRKSFRVQLSHIAREWGYEFN